MVGASSPSLAASHQFSGRFQRCSQGFQRRSPCPHHRPWGSWRALDCCPQRVKGRRCPWCLRPTGRTSAGRCKGTRAAPVDATTACCRWSGWRHHRCLKCSPQRLEGSRCPWRLRPIGRTRTGWWTDTRTTPVDPLAACCWWSDRWSGRWSGRWSSCWHHSCLKCDPQCLQRGGCPEGSWPLSLPWCKTPGCDSSCQSKERCGGRWHPSALGFLREGGAGSDADRDCRRLGNHRGLHCRPQCLQGGCGPHYNRGGVNAAPSWGW
jgi:hypothetical protein